jgi:phosphoribosyl-AMP cyclohydrolase
MSWQDAIKWDEQGLVAAIAQDAASGRVLMVAWMNQNALEVSLREGRAVYWSVQHIRELRLDCDGDAILMRVEQVGGIACHTGRQSCFYRVFEDGTWRETDEVLRDPAQIYGSKEQEKRGE